MTRRTVGLAVGGVLATIFAGAGSTFAAEEDAGGSAAAAPVTGEAGAEGSGDASAPAATPAAKAPRDPFRPFNLSQGPRRKPETPLEQYDLGSLTLVAVIWKVSDPKAMVEDDAGLGYTVRAGTPIGRNGGTVRRIEPNRIIVEEEFVDFYGEKKKKEVVLALPAEEEGEKRP